MQVRWRRVRGCEGRHVLGWVGREEELCLAQREAWSQRMRQSARQFGEMNEWVIAQYTTYLGGPCEGSNHKSVLG